MTFADLRGAPRTVCTGLEASNRLKSGQTSNIRAKMSDILPTVRSVACMGQRATRFDLIPHRAGGIRRTTLTGSMLSPDQQAGVDQFPIPST